MKVLKAISDCFIFLELIFWLGLKNAWCLQWHPKRWAVIPQSGNSRKIICLECGNKFGMHDGLKALIPLTDEDEREMDEMYRRINS